MTIWYPDLSQYDYSRGLRQLPDGTVAVIARASFGTNFVDSRYSYWRAEAARVGAVFGAYHWLHDGDIEAQAAYCYAAVGDTPVMVDAEDVAGNTGYTRTLTVADITGFVTALRALGGRVGLVYLPHWYWQQHMGSPDLTPLVDLGVGLVNSNYTAYSDTGPGWQPYGQIVPAVWQYTDALPYGGSTCDFNAFRGTVDEFRALITGKNGDDDMKTVLVRAKGDPRVYLSNGLMRWHIPDQATLGDVINGVNPVLGALADTVVHEVLNLDAFGVEIPAGLPATVADLAAKIATAQTVVAPTQDQVNAAVLAAMKDPTVTATFGAAVASHIHVS